MLCYSQRGCVMYLWLWDSLISQCTPFFLEAVVLIKWLESPVRKLVKVSVQGNDLVGLGHYLTRCSICTELMFDVWHFVCMALLDLTGPGKKRHRSKRANKIS